MPTTPFPTTTSTAAAPMDPPAQVAPAQVHLAAPAAASAAKAANSTAELLGEPVRPVWYRRPLWWAVAAAVALALGGGLWWQSRKAALAAPSYNTQPVARGNLTLTVTANGTLQPTRAISIGSELSGTVLKVLVDVNDVVKRGQVLVELDTAKLQGQVLRSEATLAAANAKVALTAATVAEAESNVARFEEVARLSNGQVPSQAELDAAHAADKRAHADATSAQASVRDAQAALTTDQINLGKASIRAPADGVVLTRSVDPGNTVAASLQAVTLLSVAEDLSKLRLWVYVDEADVGTVKLGQNATFTVSAFLSRKFPARITRVGFGSTITDNVVTYLTYLDVDNTDLRLRPGMTATATIVADTRDNVLLVPNTALRFTPTVAAEGARTSMFANMGPRIPGAARKSAASGASTALAKEVWVLGRAGSPESVAVTPGMSDGHMTEITAGALEVGMQVITDQKIAAKP